jgi:chromosome segregation ATPase
VYGFETPEEAYLRISRERGWFDETSFERLAATVIVDLTQERNAAEDSRNEYEAEASYLQDRVDALEADLREQEEELRGQDSEQRVEELETEVEFLKSLVTDMEEELAALDVAV